MHNPIGRAQRNVAHHYDLGDDLYDLFLDPERQYSCAYFKTPLDNLPITRGYIEAGEHALPEPPRAAKTLGANPQRDMSPAEMEAAE